MIQIQIEVPISVSFHRANSSYTGANLQVFLFGSQRDLSPRQDQDIVEWIRSFDHTQLSFPSPHEFIEEIFKKSKKIWPGLQGVRLDIDSTLSLELKDKSQV